MRNFMAIVLAAIFGFLGALGISYIPKGLTAPLNLGIGSTANLTSLEPNDNNAVEVDGIRFEILMPERVLKIPDKQLDTETPVKIGIRITNNTEKPVRFPTFDPFMVIGLGIVGSDGKYLKIGGGRNLLLNSPQIACPLAAPKESLIFFLDAKLFWQNNQLVFGGSDGLGGAWGFVNIQPGIYQAQFGYVSQRPIELSCYNYDELKAKGETTIQEVWRGEASTPFVEFRLVQI